MQTDIAEGSPESDELEALSILVEEYDSIHYPIP
jgi:HTH-type transcriptional regulator/antitoxin HigA